MIYSIPYILLVLFYFILYFVEYTIPTKKNIIRYICFFTYLFFFGARGYIGSDWHNYYLFYNDLLIKGFSNQSFEIGFYLFSKCCAICNFNFETYIFIITLLQLFLLDRFLIKNISNFSIAYLILISFFPILILDTQRNFLSILIFLQIFTLKEGKSIIKTIVLFLISLSFHTSAIFLIIFYFLFYKKYLNKKMFFVLIFIGLIIYITQLQYLKIVLMHIANFLGGTYGIIINSYLQSESYATSYGLNIGIIEKIFLLLLLFFNYNQLIYSKKIKPFFLNSFIFYCLCYLFFNEFNIFINRVTLLFFYSYQIMGSFLCSYKLKKSNRLLIIIFFVILALTKTHLQYNKPIYEYKNIIFQNDNYSKRINELRNHYESFGY